MVVIEDNFNKKLSFNTCIALGSFDGLHKGHMKLIRKTIEESKKNNSKSMVLTFKEHPLNVINKKIAPKLLSNNDQKIDLLSKTGIDIINFINFNEDYMKFSPKDFILNILKYYNVNSIIVGFNYRFGYKNLGDISLLTQLSKEYNVKLNVISPVTFNDETISSSVIRSALIDDGDILKATAMLGRCYELKGTIIKGKQLGRELGFPTANLNYDKKYVLPKEGVYYTVINYNDKLYKGITNIGCNPTVNDKKISVETHILNFNKNIYGENISIRFIEKLRDEQKFSSLEKLKNQLEKDRLYAINHKI